MALNMTRAGIAVLWIAIDESAPDVALRVAQMLKFRATEVMSRTSSAMRQARGQLSNLPFELIDADQGEVFVETAIERFASKFPDQKRAVIVDSIQTARTESSDAIQDPRSKLDDVIGTLKKSANHEGTRCAILATVELSRSAYRNSSQAHNVDPLAAGKESGALEYRANALIDIRNEKGAPDIITVTAVKARGYGTHRGHVFAMKLDRETATFQPVTLHAAANEIECSKEMKLLGIVQSRPDLGTNELRGAMNTAPNALQTLLDKLSSRGLVKFELGKRRKKLWRITEDGSESLKRRMEPASKL